MHSVHHFLSQQTYMGVPVEREKFTLDIDVTLRCTIRDNEVKS
jgi:hypothetical protein